MPTRILLFLAAGAIALGLALVVVVLSSPQVRAGPPPSVTVRDAVSLQDGGQALTLTVKPVDGVELIESRPMGAAPGPRMVAAASDGMVVALTPVDPGQIGPLVLARADGSQVEIGLPGVRGAAFAPAGGWLAVVDLAGGLWRVDHNTGVAVRLADGPFGPDISVLPDGRILSLLLSSAEAPIWSAAQLVDPDNGRLQPVANVPDQDQLVYVATVLADRAVALIRHRAEGGLSAVLVGADGSESPLTDLDRGTAIDLSPAGDWLAWSDADQIWLQPTRNGPPSRPIGRAPSARFSPDGSFLLLFHPAATEVVATDGSHRADAGLSACWLGGGRGCRP